MFSPDYFTVLETDDKRTYLTSPERIYHTTFREKMFNTYLGVRTSTNKFETDSLPVIEQISKTLKNKEGLVALIKAETIIFVGFNQDKEPITLTSNQIADYLIKEGEVLLAGSIKYLIEQAEKKRTDLDALLDTLKGKTPEPSSSQEENDVLI